MLAQPSGMIPAQQSNHWLAACAADLLPHQPDAVQFLAARQFAILADEMGLGKTVEAIRAADLAMLQLVLVIAPKSMCRQWAREFAKWQLLKRPITVIETRAQVPEVFQGVYIVSWALLSGIARALSTVAWHVLIADEAQNAKNPYANRTEALYGQHASGYGLVRSSRRVWLLSGGLTPNNPAELWTHLRALWPERINHCSLYQFTDHYCLTREGLYGPSIVGSKNTDHLLAILRDIRLARSARLLNLPPLWFGEIAIDPNGPARQELARAYRNHADEAERLTAILDSCRTDFRNVAALEAAELGHSELRHAFGRIKAPMIAHMMAEELKFYTHKLIIFCWHLDVLDYFAQHLGPFGIVKFTGATSHAQREQNRDAFNNDPGTRVGLGQIIAGGVGIPLTGGNQVAFPELSWCPLDNLQAAKRPHRIGQQWPVYARSFSLNGSIDEQVSAVLMRKMRMINAIQEEENRYAASAFPS